MTQDEIRRANLIKMGFACNKCGLIYEDGHPIDSAYFYRAKASDEIKDKCNNEVGSTTYYSFRAKKILRNFSLFRIRGKWFKVRGPLVDMFIRMAEIEEGVMGNIYYPRPTEITRQVDIFTAAEKLGLPPPLNDYQQKRAKTRAFVERIKK
jgi:hypothetical protein